MALVSIELTMPVICTGSPLSLAVPVWCTGLFALAVPGFCPEAKEEEEGWGLVEGRSDAAVPLLCTGSRSIVLVVMGGSGGGVLIRLSKGDSRRGLWRKGKRNGEGEGEGEGEESSERVAGSGINGSWDSSSPTPTSTSTSLSSIFATASVDDGCSASVCLCSSLPTLLPPPTLLLVLVAAIEPYPCP